MMVNAIIGLALLANTAIATVDNMPQWDDIGVYKVTEYCAACNDGSGTSTGTPLYEGICASDPSVIPYGSTIRLGETDYTLTMADYCGNAVNVEPTIDVYRDWGDGCCHCADSYYTTIYVKR